MTLSQELAQLAAARRIAPAGRQPGAPLITHQVIDAALMGDNILLPPGQHYQILEVFLWNALNEQTLILRDGASKLLRITKYPAASGYLMGFAGNGTPHFSVTPGNAFVLNLSAAAGQVDGFIKYTAL